MDHSLQIVTCVACVQKREPGDEAIVPIFITVCCGKIGSLEEPSNQDALK